MSSRGAGALLSNSAQDRARGGIGAHGACPREGAHGRIIGQLDHRHAVDRLHVDHDHRLGNIEPGREEDVESEMVACTTGGSNMLSLFATGMPSRVMVCVLLQAWTGPASASISFTSGSGTSRNTQGSRVGQGLHLRLAVEHEGDQDIGLALALLGNGLRPMRSAFQRDAIDDDPGNIGR